MKTINKLLSLMIILTLSSCLVDDDVASDSFDQGSNVVGFSKTKIPASVSADGNTSSIDLPLEVTGPSSLGMTEDVTVTISVDPSSTAEEGVHFMLDGTTTTLTADGGYTGSIPLTIMTAGITPPLAESPVVKLMLTTATGDNLVISGRSGLVSVEINYLCYSDLAGNYTNPAAPDCNGSDPITVTLDSPGRYFVSSMSAYSWQSGECIGFYMIDVCGVLTYDGGDLEDNGNTGGGTGYVNADGQSFNFTNLLVEAGYSAETTFTRI